MGATDAVFFISGATHYLFVSNYADDNGNTAVNCNLYAWDDTRSKFGSVPVQYVATTGARAVSAVTIDDVVYVVVASYYDAGSRSYMLQ